MLTADLIQARVCRSNNGEWVARATGPWPALRLRLLCWGRLDPIQVRREAAALGPLQAAPR